jgi:hypothetical protein
MSGAPPMSNVATWPATSARYPAAITSATQPQRRTSAAPISESATKRTSFANEFGKKPSVVVSPLTM